MALKHAPIHRLREMATFYSRPDEVDDLVQDVLLEAVRTRRDFDTPEFLGWARGVLQRRAAFIARSSARRKNREESYTQATADAHHCCTLFPQAFVESLNPSTRMVALMLNCGLNRKEITCVLGISDDAFRQRLTGLRRRWRTYASGGGRPDDAPQADPPFKTGLMRRSLKASLRMSENRAFGSHDPDGHLFAIRSARAHKSGGHGNNGIEPNTNRRIR